MRIYLFLPFLMVAMGVASCTTLRTPAVPVPVPPAPANAPPVSAPSPAQALPPVEQPTAEQPTAEQPFFTEEGVASLYGKKHQGHATATGEHFDRTDLTAAHRTLAFGTVVRVTNIHNGKTVKVRINDRGPHIKGRVIDLSTTAARALGFRDGLAKVRVEAFASDQPSGKFPP